jgi:hypothetical protein
MSIINKNISLTMKKYLEDVSLYIKASFLLITTIMFFFFVFFVSENKLTIYFAFLLAVIILMGCICYVITGKRTFWFTMKLWAIGTVIYLLIVIPYTFSGGSLSPYIKLHNNFNRYLYSFFLPLRLLGIYFIGLTFLEITSPTEFLKFGTVGQWITFLFRIIEFARQTFRESIISLRMQGEWPDEGRGIVRFREAWLTIKKGPTLAIVTFRNIIIWFPKAWLYFNKLQNNMRES